MNEDLQCPIDHVKVNENKIRVIALLVLLLAAVFLLTGYRFIILFLLADFFTRAFNLQAYSLLGWLAGVVTTQFKIPAKPVDRGPKRFAAGMGFVFTLLILVTMMLNWNTVLIVLTAALCFFAFLESFAAVCVGCYVYTGLKKIRKLTS